MAERDWITRYFVPLATSENAAGLTDDVAQLRSSDHSQIVTVDSLVEGVHFRPEDPIDAVARKLVRVNVSDILASGAVPSEALLALGWPKGRREEDLERFAAALGEELNDWGIDLVGGDTVSVPSDLFVSLTLTGDCIRESGPVRRKGAQPGDRVWITGLIGAARQGFLALQAGELDSPWSMHYHAPQLPPATTGELIATYANSAMDVSDGLLRDASTLAAASGVGIRLELDRVPFAGEPCELTEKLDLACWGDDYQALFTAPETATESILSFASEAGIRISQIGEIRASELSLTVFDAGHRVNLPETLGFEHG